MSRLRPRHPRTQDTHPIHELMNTLVHSHNTYTTFYCFPKKNPTMTKTSTHARPPPNLWTHEHTCTLTQNTYTTFTIFKKNLRLRKPLQTQKHCFVRRTDKSWAYLRTHTEYIHYFSLFFRKISDYDKDLSKHKNHDCVSLPGRGGGVGARVTWGVENSKNRVENSNTERVNPLSTLFASLVAPSDDRSRSRRDLSKGGGGGRGEGRERGVALLHEQVCACGCAHVCVLVWECLCGCLGVFVWV